MTRSALERARDAFDRQAWSEVHAALTEADAGVPLGTDDLERLALANHLLGDDEATTDVLARAHAAALEDGDQLRAVRNAFWLTLELLLRGETAQAGGWLSRAERLLADHPESVERGYVSIPLALRQQEEGDFAAASVMFEEIGRIAERFGDPDLATLARLGRGESLIALEETRRGIALLDEAMLAVTAGEVSPVVTGIVYCSVIESCQNIFDLGRAQEWTAALDRWCRDHPDMVRYRGQCLLYRADLLTLHGSWDEAAEEAELAVARLAGPRADPALGAARYRQAEIHRLRGDLAQAEQAYIEAARAGRPAEPGLALLRMAQGRADAAWRGVRRALDESGDPRRRPYLLEAAVEVAIATGRTDEARTAAAELSAIADASGAPLLKAMAAGAEGRVLLAGPDPGRAIGRLRQAWSAWQALDAPYESARLRELIGVACHRAGDDEAAGVELEAAREAYRRLGAGPDIARVDGLTGGARAPGHGLTERELEVVRLVASGRTNRTIAEELGISDKTVARHVANIFTKLDVSSRSAATAWAYEHDQVRRPTQRSSA